MLTEFIQKSPTPKVPSVSPQYRSQKDFCPEMDQIHQTGASGWRLQADFTAWLAAASQKKNIEGKR
jgi:hypothetical protein